jgi:hypothetical protein
MRIKSEIQLELGKQIRERLKGEDYHDYKRYFKIELQKLLEEEFKKTPDINWHNGTVGELEIVHTCGHKGIVRIIARRKDLVDKEKALKQLWLCKRCYAQKD